MKQISLSLVALIIGISNVFSGATFARDIDTYGSVQAEVSASKTGKTTSILVGDYERGTLGFRASEDLGSHLRGIAKVEFQFDTADGDAREECNVPAAGGSTVENICGNLGPNRGLALTFREINVGLQGGFGSIKIGVLKSPYKYMGGYTYDSFVATSLQARGNGGMSGGVYGHDGFIQNAIGYYSPKVSGIQLWGVLNPEDRKTNALDANNIGGDVTTAHGGAWSVGGRYHTKLFEVMAATVDDGSSGTDPKYKIGGQLNMIGHRVSTQVEVIGSEQIYYLAYRGKFNKILGIFQAGLNTGFETPDNQRQIYAAAGGIYKFTKQTHVFGGAGYHALKSGKEALIFTVGMRKDF